MPQYPIDPEKLLDHAQDLAGAEAGRGRPSYTNHRRAVSSAYYAVFHQVTANVGERLFPGEEAFQIRARRSISHDAVRTVSTWIGGSAPQQLEAITSRIRGDAEVQQIAASLIGLKEAREEADYDHLRPFDKAETLALVNEARATVDMLRGGGPGIEAMMSLIALKASPR